MFYLSENIQEIEKLTNQQLIKEENIKRLFNLLNRNREMARADMVRATHLSPTTVSALVDELVREGLVVETGYARTMQTGRKPINLRINADGRQLPVFALSRAGVRYTLYNLEMEAMESAFVSCDSAQMSGRGEGAGAEYAALIRGILRDQARMFRPEIALAVCLCMPGARRAGGEYLRASMPVKLEREALLELERELGAPMFVGSTSQSLAYAEKKQLEREGQRANELIYLNVGDGVGAGVICGDEIFSGGEGLAGEIGHATINYLGRPCACGGRGCLEQYVNMKGVIERAEQIDTLRPVETFRRMRAESGRQELNLAMIGAAYDAGEQEIVEAVNTLAEQLFAGIHNAACMAGIRKIVIGGGIEEIGAGMLDQLRRITASRPQSADLQLDYGRVPAADAGRGVAEYFVDRRFEIGRGRGTMD